MKLLVRLSLFSLVHLIVGNGLRAQSTGNPALAIRQLGGGQIQLN